MSGESWKKVFKAKGWWKDGKIVGEEARVFYIEIRNGITFDSVIPAQVEEATDLYLMVKTRGETAYHVWDDIIRVRIIPQIPLEKKPERQRQRPRPDGAGD